MSVIIKGMEMPIDCLACRIACDKESYMVIGRPPKCPLTEATDLISRADAIEAVASAEPKDKEYHYYKHIAVDALSALPSAENSKAKTQNSNQETQKSNGDLINRADAIDAICKVWCYTTYGMCPHDDGYCKGCDEIEAIDALPSADAVSREEYERLEALYDAIRIYDSSAEAEQVTGKLKNPCDSLLKDDSAECKEQKSKLDLISRGQAIEAVVCHIWHSPNELYKRFNCENVVRDVVTDAINRIPSAELPKGDLISRRWLLDLYGDYIGDNGEPKYHVPLEVIRQNIKDAPSAEAVQTQAEKCDECIHKETHKDKMTCKECVSAEAVQGWIPCSERLPDVDREVLASGYYNDVYIATLKEDKREEYYWSAFGGFPVMFSAVDAWMPLPKPYKGGGSE